MTVFGWASQRNQLQPQAETRVQPGSARIVFQNLGNAAFRDSQTIASFASATEERHENTVS